MKTLLIGLDAACLPILEPLFDGGDLPRLETLFNDGRVSDLKSQIPPWTASAWPSLYTGVNPGKHGVFDFLRFDGYEWDIVNATDVRQRSLWEYVDAAGMSSVVVNVPVTSPPPEIDGAIVPGYLASENPTCHPPGILEDIEDVIGEYRVYARRETESVAGQDRFNDYLTLVEMREEAFRYLVDRFDPDFGFVEFQTTDKVFHDYPSDRSKVRTIYQAVDDAIGKILEDYDPDTVLVVSDHGIGRYSGYEFRINQYLATGDWLQTTTGGQGVPSWFQIKDEELTTETSRSMGERGLRWLATLAASVGLTHQRGKAILEKLGLAEFVSRQVPIGAVFAASESVDYPVSQAYLRSPSELGVRLNVENRDPEGTVPQEEYDEVREELISVLTDVRAPDGTKVFDEVVPRESYFDGPYAEEAVDVLTVPTDFEHELSALIGDEFTEPEEWNHKPEGVLCMAGEVVEQNADIGDPHLFDVAPTVLASLDIPPATVMDGNPLNIVPAPDPKQYPPYEPSTQDTTTDAAVADRLSDLGYIE